MTTSLLDTSAVVAIIRGRPLIARDRLRTAIVAGDDVVVSSVVTYDLWYGVARGARGEENARLLRDFLANDAVVWSFTEDDAVDAGALRAESESAGTPIEPYDVLIAAQARRHGATVVTANTRAFVRVPDLVFEDWTRTASA